MDLLLPGLVTTARRAAPAGSPRRSAPQPLAVALFNDGGDTPHVVRLASSDAHRRLLTRAGAHVRHAYFRSDWRELGRMRLGDGIAAALASPELRRVFAEVDLVVVLGDTLASEPSRHLLAILGAAQQLDLPTYLVGASMPPRPEGRDILQGLTDCTVRDEASAAILKTLGVPHRPIDDAVVSASFADEPARDFTHHLVVTDCEPARRIEFTADLAAARHAWPGMVADYPLDAPGSAFGWRHALADLGTAAAVLTGGRDGATLALAAGVPFVVLGPASDAAVFVASLDGYPAAAADWARPLPERLQAALDARDWFTAAAAALRARRGALDAYSRLRPGLALAGRDDTWTESSDGTLDVVEAVTPSGGSVLHAGAGQGQLVDALSKAGFRAWGADVARRLDRPDRTRYSKATPDALPFADHVFSTVVVSADWLEHLETDQVERAVKELTRVAKEHVIVEVSGRPLRADRPHDTHVGDEAWRRRLTMLGLGESDATDALVTHGAGPTGGTLLVMRAETPLCPSCRRAHADTDHIEPVHPGVLQAAAQAGVVVVRR